MVKVVEPANREATLREWRGAKAQVRMFHPTFVRMALLLSRPGEQEVLYVLAAGCERICGPVSWKDADLSLARAPAAEGHATGRVVDVKAGFELRCSDLFVALGPLGPQPPDPFVAFVRDAPETTGSPA